MASKSRIDSRDPVQASRAGQMQVLSALGDPLYAVGADSRIEPRLATGSHEDYAKPISAVIGLHVIAYNLIRLGNLLRPSAVGAASASRGPEV